MAPICGCIDSYIFTVDPKMGPYPHFTALNQKTPLHHSPYLRPWNMAVPENHRLVCTVTRQKFLVHFFVFQKLNQCTSNHNSWTKDAKWAQKNEYEKLKLSTNMFLLLTFIFLIANFSKSFIGLQKNSKKFEGTAWYLKGMIINENIFWPNEILDCSVKKKGKSSNFELVPVN